MTEFGFIPGMVLAITAALTVVTLLTLAFVRVGSKRWKVVAEGVVDKVVQLEVPAGVMPMQNGFITPAVSMTMVNFTDGTRTEIPEKQASLCVKGRRIQVYRNWLGDRKVLLTSLFD